MKKTYGLIFLMLFCMFLTSCAKTSQQDNKDEEVYVMQTENGNIEIESSNSLWNYRKVLLDYTKEGACYAFIRIAGSNEPIFLISDCYMDIKIGNYDYCVTGIASAYIIQDDEVHFLGKLESEMPRFSLCIDQQSYLYTVVGSEDVRRWVYDEERNALIAVDGAYNEEENGVKTYKYFNEETEGRIKKIDNESALLAMHAKHAEAIPIRFRPLFPYSYEQNE